MARTRTRRQADTTTKPQLPTTADRDPASPPSDNIDNDGRESRDADREIDEAGDAQEHRLWTPEPEPYDTEKYKAWGRKHYGDDWYEQRETMLQERNFLKSKGDDYIYKDRQKALREMEREREQGRLSLKKGKTWQELQAWARMHYGEVWYKQREALERDEREKREALDTDERKKKSLKAAKRHRILREMELERDEGMLAEGKTWREIMAWPTGPSNVLPSVETGDDVVSSPSSSSGHSDRSGISTYPPTPTDFRRQAMDGPQMANDQKEKGDGNWEWLELKAIGSRLSEARYEENRVEMEDRIRSSREDKECERRNDAEWEAIRKLHSKFDFESEHQYIIEKEKRERRMRDLDLRQKGWTQEQIDAMDREEAAAQAAARERWKPPQKELLTQEELDAKQRTYDAWGISREEQAEMFGLKPEPEPGKADAPASERVSQPRASSHRPPKDTSRKTRGGRITKSTAQSQSVTNRGTRSRQAATPAEAPTPDRRSKRARASDVVDKPDESTAQVPRKTRKRQPKVYKKRASDAVQDIDDRGLQSKPHNTRQRKAYKQERGSRRLAGRLPEYGMLPKRGEPAPPYEPPSNIRKPNPSGPRSRASSKKSIAVKGANPRGISKSGREGTNRPKRSKKGSEGEYIQV
jgi:hypothetical protein